MAIEKERVDVLACSTRLFTSREQAKRAIMAGESWEKTSNAWTRRARRFR